MEKFCLRGTEKIVERSYSGQKGLSKANFVVLIFIPFLLHVTIPQQHNGFLNPVTSILHQS